MNTSSLTRRLLLASVATLCLGTAQAQSFPAKPVTLKEAIAGEPRLQAERDADERVAKMLDIAQKLEGLYRHASTHAAGVVIGDRPLDELVPLFRDTDNKDSLPATQFNMKWVEPAGLVKFDFLGLKTLTVLRAATDALSVMSSFKRSASCVSCRCSRSRSSTRVKAAAGRLKEARQHLEQVNDPAMAVIKSRLARELADKALPVPNKDDERRLNLPGPPK